MNDEHASITAPQETMTRGRVYVTVDTKKDMPAYITYYGNDLKKSKSIDLLIPHSGVLPHVHHGLDHRKNDQPISKKQLEGLSLERYDAWLAARKDFKYTPEMKEPRMTQRQWEIYRAMQEGDYSGLDKANKNTFTTIEQMVAHDLHVNLKAVTKSSYSVEEDYFTKADGTRVDNSYSFPQTYKRYRDTERMSNEVYSRSLKRGYHHM